MNSQLIFGWSQSHTHETRNWNDLDRLDDLDKNPSKIIFSGTGGLYFNEALHEATTMCI